MRNINVVYVYLDPNESHALRRGDVRIVWSASPVPDCDLYAYVSAYSFSGRRPGPQVLVQAEPVVTQPREFTCEVFGQFDHVLTLLDALDGITPQVGKWQFPVCKMDVKSEPLPEESEFAVRYPTEGRRNAICMINGYKASAIPGELYSRRVEMALWFHEHSDIPFDVFGKPAFVGLPNYIRSLEAEEKRSVLAGYRYSLCLENCYDPFWSRGYLTEKLTECLACRTVPIYLGCANIEEYIPTSCFIDYRDFEGCEQLNDYIRGMSDRDYQSYVDNIDEWLSGGGLRAYAVSHLYDKLTELLADAVGDGATSMWRGESQWQSADMPDEPPTRDVDADGSLITWIEMNRATYWSWDYLTRASLDDCVESVDAMRKTQALGPTLHDEAVPDKQKSTRVSRLLYLGVQTVPGDSGGEFDYNVRNFLMDWRAWPDIDVHYFDPAARAQASGVAGMSEEAIECALGGNFDLVFCVPYARGIDVLHDTMRRITLHANTMMWLPYRPDLFETHSLPWASCVDRLVTTSETDYRAFQEAGYGDRVVQSQWAFSPSTYGRVRAKREPMVMLVGQRTDVRAQACEYVASSGISIAAYGHGWGEGRFLPLTRFQRRFSESAINLSLGSRRRVYEVTGSGGFLMTTPVEGLDDAFVTDAVDPDRAEVVVVHAMDELVEKARYYIERGKEREAIARRGYKRAHAHHTWTHRFADVFSKVGWELPELPPERSVR
ncbi:glycosyltransferase [Candidatus Poribacteria bacterium]|jgi:hypothetical protein|nr:glycosyltransferase [Candidatus Poribacteria bacterium]MBT5532408.1 glycosyltransferase [Candidatus Poribacteria bacterium]MBT7096415.1 glycosyltransferase [Candidatus Poribacteria bacterium]MBT7807671.1 glycosyltransferase [Candidatus Poribacteria bacterium]